MGFGVPVWPLSLTCWVLYLHAHLSVCKLLMVKAGWCLLAKSFYLFGCLLCILWWALTCETKIFTLRAHSHMSIHLLLPQNSLLQTPRILLLDAGPAYQAIHPVHDSVSSPWTISPFTRSLRSGIPVESSSHYNIFLSPLFQHHFHLFGTVM